jgi:hypothetical protein
MKKNYFTITLIYICLFFNTAISQTNIAPLATFSGTPGCSTGACSTFNDLNFGVCGTQQVWISGGNNTPAGQLAITAEWNTQKSFNEFIIHHAQNNTRFLCGGLIQVWKNGVWVNHFTFTNLPLQCINSVVFPKVKTDKVRITAFQICGSQLSNVNFREIEIIEVPDIPNDARPYSFDKPGQAICNNIKDVEVSIENPGLNNLTSVKVNWTVIRGANTFPVNSYNWSGNLANGAVAQNILVGSFTPGFEKGDIFKCWTESPNGVPDSSAETDTLELIIREGVSGEYNVGGIFNIDFSTLGQVENFVDSFGAVCDSLIFNFRDGVYEGNLTLNEIFNTSPNRPVVFRAENGINGNVIIIDSSLVNQSLINLDLPKNIFFENIKFLNHSLANGNVITVNGELNNLNFINCHFENLFSDTTNSENGNLVNSSSNLFGATLGFESCTFLNGNTAINLFGLNEDSLITNLIIKNSFFYDQAINSISVNNVKSIDLFGNEFSSNSLFSNSKAVAVNNSYGGLSVDNNTIGSLSGWPKIGVEIINSQGTPNLKNHLINNKISIGIGDSAIGINSENSSFFNFLNNSISANAGAFNSTCFKISGGGVNRVINNVFANFSGGISANYEDVNGFPVYSSDFNNFFTTGSILNIFNTSNYFNISTWSGAIGDDANSITTDPIFVSTTDLHVCSPSMNNLGKPLANVLFDADGQNRSAINPDMGADEYSPANALNLGNDTVVCKGTELVVDGSLNFNDFYNAWSTGDSSAIIIITQPGTYSIISSNVCGTDADTIVVGLSPSANLGTDTNICANSTLLLDANVGNSTYQWNTGETSKTKTINEAGIYTVTVIDNNFCETSDTINVTQSQMVSLPSDTSICGGKSIFLDPGTGPGTYTWSSGQTAPLILATNSGNYTVTYTDLFGCVSTGATDVVITTSPDANFTDTTIGYAVSFFGKSYPNATYNWSFGDGDTSLQQNPIHLYKSPGVYVATLQISNDCGADFFSKELTVILPSAGDIETSSFVKIFPNPSIGQVNISTLNKGNLNIEVFDIAGKLVYTSQTNNTLQTNVDLSSFDKGIYTIKVFDETNWYQEKLIIQ